MGLFSWIQNLLSDDQPAQPSSTESTDFNFPKRTTSRPRLYPLRRKKIRQAVEITTVKDLPYRFAWLDWNSSGYLDLANDGDSELLSAWDLPQFQNPEQLADWLELPLGKVAWLTNRFSESNRPETAQRAHYHFHWIKKRNGNFRLIEAPKQQLKIVQRKILTEILNGIPPHENAHGFEQGRSILSNAEAHIGNRVIVKFDLENFYPSVKFSRVAAIFRSLGYSREAALWLTRLTTSTLPTSMKFPENRPFAVEPYLPGHLPQGAPTSPALANLSAYSLDVRLSGLAQSFSANYTRYADDLTFSGPQSFLKRLRTFIPLTNQIISAERFRPNRHKQKVIRNNQRQTVTGVVVNEKSNISRTEFDRLKAMLTNCLRHGPASQNREQHENFSSHLRGKIAHVQQLNAQRGQKLLDLYEQIAWTI